MNPLIVEYFTTEEETSIGIYTRLVPHLRFIYFEVDEDTGAKSVKDIWEVRIPDYVNGPAYLALHGIDWGADFDGIEFRDITEDGVGTFCEINRMDMSDNGSASRIASYMLHMIWAHCGGYLDYEGSILDQRTEDAQEGYERAGIFGKNLLAAYQENDDCDHGPYLSAGTTAHVKMVRAN